ncbi:MAG TPA: biotin/lipoyl-containing protein [Anaerolineales bacterium]
MDRTLGALAALKLSAMVKYITTINGKEYLIEILDSGQVSVNGQVYEVDFESISGQPVYSLLVDGSSYQADVYPGDEGLLQVLMRGVLYEASVEDEREKRLSATGGQGTVTTGEYLLRAPMPGLVVNIPLQDGEPVKKGDVLLILESMKMQNELKSPREGKVARIQVKAGDSVEQRQILLAVE